MLGVFWRTLVVLKPCFDIDLVLEMNNLFTVVDLAMHYLQQCTLVNTTNALVSSEDCFLTEAEWRIYASVN